MSNVKIGIVLGPRPEIIRLSSVIKYLEKCNQNFFIIDTGQHYDYEMNDIFYKELELKQPKYKLNIGSGTHTEQLSKIILKCGEILSKEKPDIVVVYGDTNSTLGGALASSKMNIPTVHIEAGCRSFDRSAPEEINRICVDHISDVLFPPDKVAYENLIKEGLDKSRIFLCGSMHIDSCIDNIDLAKRKSSILKDLHLGNEYAILTIHRADTTDNKNKLKSLLKILSEIDIPIVFPVHPRTKERIRKFGLENLIKNFIVTRPLGYLDFLMLMINSKVIFTDSGGVQVEANILGKPCIVLRDTTEWKKELDGMSQIAGLKKENILKAYERIDDRKKLDYSKDKDCSKRIIEKCIELKKEGKLKRS